MSNEKICKKCQLFNTELSSCRVVILHEGERFTNLPVEPNDSCFFDNEFTTKENETFRPIDDIKQVRWWVEDPKTGEPTSGNGVVKIEYPIDFFGKETE